MTKKTLNDVCELVVDCEHKTAPTQATGYPSIRTPNIGRGRLILDDVNRVSEEIYRAWTRRAIPQAGDLVLAREAPAGNVAIMPEGLKVCLGQRTVLLRPNRSQVDPHYLLYLLLADETQSKLLSYGSGATVAHVNMSDIRALPLPELPALSTQRKIGAILSAYDDLIENNTRRIKILEEMARTIYHEWFVEFRAPGVKLREATPEEMKVTGKDVFPVGWQVTNLGKVADVNVSSIGKGTEPLEINYIDIASVSTGQIDKVEAMTFANAPGRARRIVKHGDIIWSMVRPNRKSYALILNPLPNLIVSTGFAVITAKHAPYTYLYHALTTDDFVGYLTNHATGSAYPAVNADDFRNATVMLPSSSLLDSFHGVVVDLLDETRNLRERDTNLRRTRDLLLPRLVSGELDVA